MRVNLKITIISKFGNQANFARTCGKRDDWISRIIMGRCDPNDEEKKLIASKLGISKKDIDDLFLDTEMRMVAK